MKGFSLVEYIIVGAVIMILFGLTTLSLLNIKQKTTLTSTAATLITDLKSTQNKAMAGDSTGFTSPSSYGIFFGINSYTLFRGSAYVNGDPANFIVSLGDNIQFQSTTFAGNQAVFQKVSGEVTGAAGTNTVVIKNTASNEQKTISINKYGVVTGVNQ